MKVVTFGEIMLRLATPDYLRFSQTSNLTATFGGGVSPDEANLKGWFKAEVHFVGMGSQIFPKEVIGTGNYGVITKKCKQALEIMTKLRA